MLNIHIPNDINSLVFRSDQLLSMAKEGEILKEYLDWYAGQLELFFHYRDPSFVVEVNNYYKPLLGQSSETIFSELYSSATFFEIACHIHGFQNGIQHSDLSANLDFVFENAVQLVLNGNVNDLKVLLDQNPGLINSSSIFGHRAQLIHYCSSNAVESYRQIVPDNLLEIIKTLIQAGANPKNKIPVYGGLFDFFELFHTSAHPRAAGIYPKIAHFFKGIEGHL